VPAAIGVQLAKPSLRPLVLVGDGAFQMTGMELSTATRFGLNPIVVVLNKTPFYGEMGGQIGDTGEIVCPTFHFDVIDTQIDGTFTLHRGHLREGRIELDAIVTARVDAEHRQGVCRAHSATHLLHHALQKHLGKHAVQQGSKVHNDLLRFDFTNPSAVAGEELVRIENEVNIKVLAGESIHSTSLPLDEARKAGAMMLFGEKYPDVVRMVSVGDFSKELCGGTHLDNIGRVGVFKIIGEESVAAGTRRITALTGRAAMEHIHRTQTVLGRVAATLRVPPNEVADRVEAIVKEVRQLKKHAAAGPKGGPTVDQLIADAAELGGVKVIIAEVSGGPNELRGMIDQLRRKAAPVAVLLANGQEEEKKVTLIAAFSRDLVERGLDAVAWVRATASVVDGSGGGRSDMAQAGGKLPDKLPQALEIARSEIEKLLGAN